MRWTAVGFLAVVVTAYFIASATGRPVHLDQVSTVSGDGPTSSRWYLVVGKGAGQVRLGIPGTFKDLQEPRTVVLVATQLIPKGTLASIVATKPGMYRATVLPPNEEREAGAVAEPDYLPLRSHASVDILPGQQITATDFTASDVGRG